MTTPPPPARHQPTNHTSPGDCREAHQSDDRTAPITTTRAGGGDPCAIASAVAYRVRKRAEAGLEKYGVTMERTDLTLLDWLQHLQDELLDAAVYVEKLKRGAKP